MANNPPAPVVHNLENKTRLVKIRFSECGDDEEPEPEEETAYIVHECLLANSSPYLRRLVLAADPQEALDMVIITPNLNRNCCFYQYQNWLYTGCFDVRRDVGEPNGMKHVELEIRSLITLYLFGKELEDTTLQDAVIDATIARVQKPEAHATNEILNATTVNWIYTTTPSSGKLRSLVVAIYASRAVHSDVGRRKFPADFLRDLTIHMLHCRGPAETLELNNCTYHSHAANGPCNGTKKRKRA